MANGAVDDGLLRTGQQTGMTSDDEPTADDEAVDVDAGQLSSARNGLQRERCNGDVPLDEEQRGCRRRATSLG